MSQPDRASLLKFLTKPRFAHEIAEHYGVPRKLVRFQLAQAIKSGQVFMSEKPIPQTLRSSRGKLKRLRDFVYVARRPLLGSRTTKLTMTNAGDLFSKSKPAMLSTRYMSHTSFVTGRGVLAHELLGLTFQEPTSRDVAKHHLRTKGPLRKEFDASPTKMRLGRRKIVEQLVGHRLRATNETRSLSHADRIRLFQALLNEPLPFLDIHGRFGVSKQAIRGLVEKGFLLEMWGPQAVGVRFKLSRKGEICLNELEAAARCEPRMMRKGLIRVKYKTVV